MTPLLLAPAILSFLLLAAHYLRDSFGLDGLHWLSLFLMLSSLIVPLLLLVRRRFALRAIQFLLLAACLEWLATAFDILRQRLAEHHSFRAAMIILGSVALFNLLSALLLQIPRIRRRYAAQASHPEAAPEIRVTESAQA